MRFFLVTFIVALAALAEAAPQPAEHGTGMVIPITKRNSWLLNADESIDFIVLDAHIGSAEAIGRGRANFEKNTGSTRPGAVNEVQKRDNSGAPESLSDVNSELWYGTISIGNPGQSFTVAFSTASSDLVVPSTACDSSCSGHTLWNTGSSTSAFDLGLTFSIGYGDGSSTSGEQYSDDVTIAGFTATRQTIGAAKKYSADLSSYYFPPDGVMGMGFQSISVFNSSPVMQTLSAQGQINAVFSFMLSSSGGELYIGGSDSNLYTGDFVYSPVLGQGFWEVQMDFIEGNGNTLGMYIDCVIDTSTTAIIGVADNVTSLYNALGGSAASSYGAGYYTFPCDSFPNISLWFGMTSFPLPSSSLNLGPISPGSSNCLSGIVASQDSSASSWILGDVFLTSVYTTFDITNNQVGFAQLASNL